MLVLAADALARLPTGGLEPVEPEDHRAPACGVLWAQLSRYGELGLRLHRVGADGVDSVGRTATTTHRARGRCDERAPPEGGTVVGELAGCDGERVRPAGGCRSRQRCPGHATVDAWNLTACPWESKSALVKQVRVQLHRSRVTVEVAEAEMSSDVEPATITTRDRQPSRCPPHPSSGTARCGYRSVNHDLPAGRSPPHRRASTLAARHRSARLRHSA